MSQLKKVEKPLVELSQLKDVKIAYNYFDIRVTRADKADYADIAKSLVGHEDEKIDVSNFMLKSEYDPDNDKKVERAKDADHAGVADRLKDMSNIMFKSEYDKDKDGKVDKAQFADEARHANIADKLSDMSDIMLKSQYDQNNDGIVDNSKRWDKSKKYVSPNEPNSAVGRDGDFWFQYECL